MNTRQVSVDLMAGEMNELYIVEVSGAVLLQVSNPSSTCTVRELRLLSEAELFKSFRVAYVNLMHEGSVLEEEQLISDLNLSPAAHLQAVLSQLTPEDSCQLLKDDRLDARVAAGSALQHVKRPAMRRCAMQVLASHPEISHVHLGSALSDNDSCIRCIAATGLQKLGLDARVYAAKLKALLCDEDKRVRLRAAAALAVILDIRAKLDIFGQLLKDNQSSMRQQAVAALKAVGVKHEPYVAELAISLLDPDETLRCHAAARLGEMGTLALPYLDHLVGALRDVNARVRKSAVTSLSALGSPAVISYAEEIALLLQDVDQGVRRSAHSALALLGVKGPLVALLHHESTIIQCRAASVLNGMCGKSNNECNLQNRTEHSPCAKVSLSTADEDTLVQDLVVAAAPPPLCNASLQSGGLVQIQLGNAGNLIGSTFWGMIAAEHGLDVSGYLDESFDTPYGHIDVFYQERTHGYFTPRAVLVDLEPSTLDQIRASTRGRSFWPSAFVYGHSGGCSNWAKGYFTEGPTILDAMLDAVRHQAEACDTMQGFQVCHSLGGGTGAGTASLLISTVLEEYPDSIVQALSVVPSAKVSDVVLEPCNAVLCMQQMICEGVVCYPMDNEALHEICSKTLRIKNPCYEDFNQLTSMAMSGVTAPLRFASKAYSGSLGPVTLRKFVTQLLPFPRLHFMMTAIAPLCTHPSSEDTFLEKNTITLFQDILTATNFLTAADPRHGRFLSAFALLRGRADCLQWNEQLRNVSARNSSYFVEWIPNNFQSWGCPLAPCGLKQAGVCIGNSTAIQEVLRRVNCCATTTMKQQDVLHCYTVEGMEENGFLEAQAAIDDLVSEYQVYQDATAEDENDFDDEDF